MAESIPVNPEIIAWAVDRSRLPEDDLAQAFPKLEDWKTGERNPTYRQLELFASKTMTPLGYFFLSAPPDESLPIPDYRTVGDTPLERPSPNLIDTIRTMQRRQAWMREYLMQEGLQPLDFIGSARTVRSVVTFAARIRDSLGLAPDWAEGFHAWEDALRHLRSCADRIGILVSTAGIVGLNTHRSLDPEEFRGFVLCDPYAPLVFVNGADAKSAQMFTLAHELAHLWIGEGGLFNLVKLMPHDDATEKMCNQVAAELLVPAHKLSEKWLDADATGRPFHTVARWFKVSPIVAARRALDLGLITRARFFAFYEQDREEWLKRKADEKRNKKGGPDFYTVQDARLGRRFAQAVVRATREGRLPFREAYSLTDLKGDTFGKYAARLTQRIQDERQ